MLLLEQSRDGIREMLHTHTVFIYTFYRLHKVHALYIKYIRTRMTRMSYFNSLQSQCVTDSCFCDCDRRLTFGNRFQSWTEKQ